MPAIAAQDEATPTPPPVSGNTDPDLIIEQRLAATAAWLREADRSRFTIQLMLVKEGPSNLRKFISRTEDLDLDKIYLYPVRHHGQPAWHILYHDYPSPAAAREAIADLPASIRSHRPFVRPLKIVADRIKVDDSHFFQIDR